MKLYYIILLSSFFFATACTGTKATTSAENETTVTDTEVDKEMTREEIILSEGYSKCEVVDMGTEDECGFVLQDLNAKQLYKPLQWSDEFASYKQAGNIVYIKYRPSKATQTVCLQSMPVMIDEMKLVE